MKTLSLLGLLGAAFFLSGCLEATLVEQRPVHRRPVVYHDRYHHHDGRYYGSRRTYYRDYPTRGGYYRHRDDDRDGRGYRRVHDDRDDDDRRKHKGRTLIIRPGYY